MKTHEFGKSDTVLIQPVGKHELPWIENEVREIHRLTSADFKYIAVEIDDWNDELSPWKAPAVFKDACFGGGAVKTLEKILMLCSDKKKYYMGYVTDSGKNKPATGIIELRKMAASKDDYIESDIISRKQTMIEDFIVYLQKNKLITD